MMGSRAKDLKFVEDEIHRLSEEARGAQTAYQTYHQGVQDAIRALLEEAGVWDEVHGMEADRAAAGQALKAKLQQLTSEAEDLQKVRNFLLKRDAPEEETDEDPVPEEETDEEVEDPAPEDPEVESSEGEVEVEEAPKRRPEPPTF